MKRSSQGLNAIVILLILLLCSATACAGQSPLSISHKVTGYSAQAASTTFDYSLHIVNTGRAPLSEIVLSLVPQPPLFMKRVSLKIDTLAPAQSVDLPLHIESRARPEREEIPAIPLWWAGKGHYATGKKIEFPVRSRAEVTHD